MKIIKLTCALLLSAWVSSANATLIFDFSFTDIANGDIDVTGEILGLENNATGAASAVNIISNSGGFGIGEYIGNPEYNLFTVVDNEITSFDFLAFGVFNTAPQVTSSSFRILDAYGERYIGMSNDSRGISAANVKLQNFVVSLRTVNVSEPGTFILLSLGIAGLCLSRRKKSL